jgi:hypothetical protein
LFKSQSKIFCYSSLRRLRHKSVDKSQQQREYGLKNKANISQKLLRQITEPTSMYLKGFKRVKRKAETEKI